MRKYLERTGYFTPTMGELFSGKPPRTALMSAKITCLTDNLLLNWPYGIMLNDKDFYALNLQITYLSC